MDSKSGCTCRLGESRSDLFALTLFVPSQTLRRAIPLFKVIDADRESTRHGPTHKSLLVRALVSQHGPDIIEICRFKYWRGLGSAF